MPAIAVEGGDDLTHAAWAERSDAVGRGLVARGVREGDCVALRFDPRAWAGFAVAVLGVAKAGGVPVLLSPGAARSDVVRAIAHSRATGLLCPPHLAPPGLGLWTAHPDDVAEPSGALPPRPAAGEVVYPPAPLAPARPCAVPAILPDVGGWLVHGWAPGSLAGQAALRGLRAGSIAGMASLAVFEPDRLCALAEQRRAAALGLTPALAAALVASGAVGRHDLSSVRRLVLSGPPSDGLRAALPGMAMAVIGAPAGPPAGDTAPVAVSQEPMLWHEQFVPGSFNLPCLVRRYQGALDVDALRWALSELVRRHQPLRSTFVLVGNEPRQVVGDRFDLPLPVLDLEGRDDDVAVLLADASSRPFDLVAGPLFEPGLVRLGQDDHLLVVRLHHTVFDDWSVDLFRRELSALYTARLDGAPSPLVEPEVSFADFCRRQRSRLAGPAGAEERAWWRAELDGAPLATQLPIGPAGEEAGEPVRVDLPPALAAGVRALAPRLRATPYMTVLAAFSALLARTTGQDDLVVATVVAHRNSRDVEPLIGCFTKKVPLRLRVDPDLPFAELVARTRGSLLAALSHQGLAFDAAVQEGLGPAAAAHGVVPQLAVVFQGETPQQVKLALPRLAVGPYEVRASRRERHFTSVADDAGLPWGDGIYLRTFLILSLLERPEGMALIARGVFDRPAVRRLLDDFLSLLADVVADPSRPAGGAGPVAGGGDDDVVDVRGFRARRSRLEDALERCPGVDDVTLVVRDRSLVAEIVHEGAAPPALADLRRTLWSALPGTLWPAEAVPAGDDPDPVAALLAAMWAEIGGRPVAPGSSYWQDFSFLHVLAEAREAGLAITEEQVARCRTPEMIAAVVSA